MIKRMLTKHADLEARDYHSLLNVDRGYMVDRFTIEPDSWLADIRLEELNLPSEGIIVLSIHRNDESVSSAPRGSYVLRPGDTVTVYGEKDQLRVLSEWQEGVDGDEAHERAVEAHDRIKRVADHKEALRRGGLSEKKREKVVEKDG